MPRKHTAQPEQQREGGFAEGIDRKPHAPDEELPPDFARGLRRTPSSAERKRRFSEGVEQTDSPQKERAGSSDEGHPRE
jgi:hypothetical protein